MAGMTGTQFHAQVIGRSKGRNIYGVIVLIAALCHPVISLPAAAGEACLASMGMMKARVAAVEENNTLVLSDRRRVKLEGLLWTAERGAPAGLQRQALAALKQQVGQTVALRAARPQLDRYGRQRAEVVLSDGTWLQGALLSRGLARAQVAPDRPECARELYAAEAEARAAGVGLWAFPQYAIRTPDSLRWRDLGSFQIVEGTVLNVKVNGRAYLNFGRNWRTDFTVTVSPDDMKTFRHAGVDPYAYAGKRIRVRGTIDRMNGFEIEVASPEAIQVISAEPNEVTQPSP
ncbi:MAG TPA: thermonuclease family protein [Rhizomicrobium sp.]|nr:thermonuclease family protein [Rhizomicrobium sp.]